VLRKLVESVDPQFTPYPNFRLTALLALYASPDEKAVVQARLDSRGGLLSEVLGQIQPVDLFAPINSCNAVQFRQCAIFSSDLEYKTVTTQVKQMTNLGMIKDAVDEVITDHTK